MELDRCLQQAKVLRRLAGENGALPLVREGYLRLAEELERKAAALAKAH